MAEMIDLIVTYDVDTTTPDGRRRLRRIAACCARYGQRVQFSVFECRTHAQFLEKLEHDLVSEMDTDSDSLRIYILKGDRTRAVRTHGIDRWVDFQDALVY